MNIKAGMAFTFLAVLYALFFCSSEVFVLTILVYMSIAFFFGEIEDRLKR